MEETRIETGVAGGRLGGCVTVGVGGIVVIEITNGVEVDSNIPVGGGGSRVGLFFAPQAEHNNKVNIVDRDTFNDFIRLAG